MSEEHDRVNRDLARRADRLATAMREFETLSLAVAHDFRQPMHAIETELRHMEDGDRAPDGPTRRGLGVIREAIRHMDGLIENLGGLCRAAARPMELVSVDMEAMVRAEWLATPGNRNIDLVLGKLPRARGSPEMLRLVWANLLANAAARCADAAHGRVEVSGGGADGVSVYSVRDNGTRLAMHFAGKLFHAFEQIQKQSPYPGTGVALAIVQRIVTRHRGNVWVESAPDGGTVFQFSIGELMPPGESAAVPPA